MVENKNLNNQPENVEEKKKKKCGFLVWWHKLSKGAKIGISAAAGVALTSAIVFPTLAATVWNKKSDVTTITKQQFVDKANEYVTNFCSSTKEYSQDQFKFELNGEVQTLELFEYSGSGNTRELNIKRYDTAKEAIASIQYSGDNLKSHLKEETETGVVYTIFKDGEINYTDSNAGDSGLKALSMNKYGYNTKFHLGARNAKFIYTGEPDKEPKPVTDISLEWDSDDQCYKWKAKSEIKAGTKFKATLKHTSSDKQRTNKLMPWPDSIIFSLTDTTANVYIENVTYNDGTKVSDLSISDNSLLYAGSEGTDQDVIFYFTVNKDYASSKFEISATKYNS